MKNASFFIILFFCYFFISCKDVTNYRTIPIQGEIIHINTEDIDTVNMVAASKYVKKVSYISLQTGQEFLIGEISKVHSLDSMFFIHDSRANKIYKFDYDGRYICSYGNIGGGPGEYIKISTFSINEKERKLSLYCERKQSLFEFDLEGNLLKELKIGFVCSDFTYCDDFFLFYGGRNPNQIFYSSIYPTQYRLCLMDENTIIKKDLKMTFRDWLVRFPTNGDNRFYTCKHTLFLSEYPNFIYEITPKDSSLISPKYYVDFGKNNVPFDLNSNISEEIIEGIVKNNKFCSIYNFIENEDYIYIKYAYRGIFLSSLYIKNEKKTINLGPIWVNDKDHLLIPTMAATMDDNKMLGYINSFDFINMFDSNSYELPQHVIKLREQINIDDNPILCIVEFN